MRPPRRHFSGPARAPRPAVRVVRFTALLAAFALLAPAGSAAADPVEDRFAAAANLIAADRDAEAAAQLEALAREAPDHALAPEALFSAGELYEDDLAEPGRALALYEELGRRYPDSRRALAASRRAAALAAQLGPSAEGVEAQRRFLLIRHGFAGRPERESVAMAEALLREFPSWAGAPAVALWLAGLDARAGRYDSALERYLGAARRYTEPEARFDALRGAGDVALALGRYDEAERHYGALDARGDPGRQAAIDDALAEVVDARNRDRLQWMSALAAAVGALGLLASLAAAAGRPRAALRALWPPPGEVLYLGPVGLLLAVVSSTSHPGLGPAVGAICAGGVATAWLSGAGLILRRRAGRGPSFAIVLAHAVLAGLSVLAIAYIAVDAHDLFEAVMDTFRYGPES